MRQLADLINSIKENVIHPVDKPSKKAKNPEWEACIHYVHKLPEDHTVVVQKNGLVPKETQVGKLTHSQFYLGRYKGFPLEIIEYTDEMGAVKKAWYVAFNNAENLAYVRSI